MKKFAYLGAFAGLFTLASCGKQTSPNVLFILTDDQGWGDFGFNGNEDISTPRLDSLQSESVHLTNFYVSPLSASTRAGILTGRYHLRTGTLGVTRGAENMSSDECTIAEALKDGGYRTGCFGKWHNGATYPQDAMGQGFDEFVGFNGGHIANYFSTDLLHNRELKPSKGFITDYLTDMAIQFMSKKSDKPFFCYLPYNAPHAPIQVPDEFYDKYKHLQKNKYDMTAGVWAMCENIDMNVGRLLDFLEQKELLENTIVVFTTDNGPKSPRYNGNLRGVKGHIYEGGFKTPCLIYWKGKLVHTQIDETLSYIDLMPTLLGLCNVDYTSDKSENTHGEVREMDGIDFSPLLNGEKIDEINNRYLFTHKSPSETELTDHESTIFNSRYKLIHRKKDSYELYDKSIDPSEKEDISTLKPEVLKVMKTQLDSCFNDVQADYLKNIQRLPTVGILDEPVTLPAHEAKVFSTTAHYNANKWGWAGDWFTDFSSEDRVHWSLNVAESGEYKIYVQYAMKEGVASIALKGQDKIKLDNFFPKKIDSPDRAIRGVAYEQIWAVKELAQVKLNKGENTIELIINGAEPKCLEIKGIIIKK